LECGSLLPLYPRELARGHFGLGCNSGQQAGPGVREKRQQAAALQTTRRRAQHQKPMVAIPSRSLAYKALEVTR
jgi:hypothetical protein